MLRPHTAISVSTKFVDTVTSYDAFAGNTLCAMFIKVIVYDSVAQRFGNILGIQTHSDAQEVSVNSIR